MKKLLSIVALAALALGSQAQVIVSTNFPNTSIPAGWTQQQAAADPTNHGWVFNSVLGGNLQFYMTPSGMGDFAFVDDIDNNTGAQLNNDTLYTPVFNASAYANVYLSCNIWYQGYYDPNNGDHETVTIAVSTDGGHTWTTAVTNPYYSWSMQYFDLSSYLAGQSNCKVAFTYSDGGAQLVGVGLDNITINAPFTYDLGVTSQTAAYLMQVGNSYTFTGTVFNYGSAAITSMHLNYSVNGGPVQTDNITGISGFTGLTTYNFSHNIAYVPAAAGNITVKYWCDNINGANADQNHANDTLSANFMVVNTIQTKKAMFEEFMQASCNPCMYATPNLDAVIRTVTHSPSSCNIVRYHVNWPGVDYMNNETQSPFVSARVGYYGVSGVPDAKIDGITDVSPATVAVSDIQNAAALGSPFTITIDSATYYSASNKFTATATITSYGNVPAGLKLQAVLTVDTITYHADQSTEDPLSSFAPPLGTTNGGNPDSLYEYVMKFPNVAEDMMPSSSGTSLNAFTPLSQQTVTVSWTKNRPWGSSPQTYKYDSLGNHITFFVQTNSAIPSIGVPANYIFQSASGHVTNTPGGFQELTSGVSYNMYPNPATNETNITFNLDNDKSVSVEVYNMLGERVASVEQNRMTSGSHTIAVNTSSLSTGMYIVRLVADGAATNAKLVIQK